jgi:hypothetical protein
VSHSYPHEVFLALGKGSKKLYYFNRDAYYLVEGFTNLVETRCVVLTLMEKLNILLRKEQVISNIIVST